jgi:hypothetical protein
VSNVHYDVGVFALCYAAASTPAAKAKLDMICSVEQGSLIEKAASIIEIIRGAVHSAVPAASAALASSSAQSRSLLTASTTATALPSINTAIPGTSAAPQPSPTPSTSSTLTSSVFSPLARATAVPNVVIPGVTVNYTTSATSSASASTISSTQASHAAVIAPKLDAKPPTPSIPAEAKETPSQADDAVDTEIISSVPRGSTAADVMSVLSPVVGLAEMMTKAE